MPLHKATCEVLEQALELIRSCETHYNHSPDAEASPIGRHIRHIIDHLWAFQHGMKTACIDYNQRHRDISLERDPAQASQALNDFIQWLKGADLPDKEITVISEISAKYVESATLSSNWQRELTYLINHTFHHVAYATLLAKSMGLDTANHLGIAPATASYLRDLEQSQCAQSR